MNTLASEPTSEPGPALSPSVVLVPLLNLGLADDMLGLAAHLMRSPASNPGEPPTAGARIVVLSVVEVPPDQPLTLGLDMARSYRALLDFLPSQVEVGEGLGYVRVDRIVKVSRNVASAIHQAAEEELADMILLYWKGHAREPRKHLYGRIVDAVLENPPCSVMAARVEGWRGARRVLLPVRGGPAAEQALDLGVALGERLGLPLTVLHNVPRPGSQVPADKPGGQQSQVQALGEEPFIYFNERVTQIRQVAHVPIESILMRGDEPAEALLSEAGHDDLVIMGLPPIPHEGKARTAAASTSLALKMSQVKGAPLLLLNTPAAIDLAAYSLREHRRVVQPPAASLRAAGAARPAWVDMPFEHWFVEHTYHGDEFRDVEEFLQAKQEAGVKLSVVLLTSNDAPRIRTAIIGLRRVLQEMHPIADQLVVVDAGSTDGTSEQAQGQGAEVYRAADVLPTLGDLHGRGECWWKSLAVVTGDIVVWLDPRARRFHPTTALSLAGPLLRIPTLQLVKAFAGVRETRRRGREERQRGEEFSPVDMSWGGFVVPRRDDEQGARGHAQVRVQALRPSDLLVLGGSQIAALPPRTLFQVLCPSLASVIDPFGRDMAARRESMMEIPAFAGENLEVGLLLSVAGEFGLNAIAQVELGEALPSLPPQPGLRNAVDLMQAMQRRLRNPDMRFYAERIEARLRSEIEGRRMPAPTDTGGLGRPFEVRALGPVERPPMRALLSGGPPSGE